MPKFIALFRRWITKTPPVHILDLPQIIVVVSVKCGTAMSYRKAGSSLFSQLEPSDPYSTFAVAGPPVEKSIVVPPAIILKIIKVTAT